jgi:hypothetical protein
MCSVLEIGRRSAHYAEMAEPPSYTILITADPGRVERFRWTINEAGKERDKSMYSFATRRHAQTDAEALVEKLIITWQTQN